MTASNEVDAGFRPFAGFRLAVSAYAATWGTGFLSYCAMPYLIGSVADGMGFGIDEAGLIGSAELLVVALSAFATSARVRSLPRRKVALLGGAIACAGHALSLLASDIAVLVACRALAGAGAGMALAVGNACIAAAHDPAKAYGQVMMLLATITAAIIVGLGYVTELWSYHGVFGAQAIIVALMLLPISMLPDADQTRPEDDVSRGSVPAAPAALIVAGILIWHFCDNSIWGFSERIATQLGMAPDAIGWLLGAGLFVGTLGGFVASSIGTRFGRIWPICVGVGVAVTCIAAITTTAAVSTYTASILAYIVCFMFISSYIYGLAGELDHHGRVMAAASGAGNLGVALAPLLSGKLIAGGGYQAMGNAVIGALVAVMLLSVLVGRHVNRRIQLARAHFGPPPVTR